MQKKIVTLFIVQLYRVYRLGLSLELNYLVFL